MQNAMTMETSAFVADDAAVRVQQMPLSFLGKGQSARVVKVRGKSEISQHLKSLGFVEGAAVRVVVKQSGNLIVEVKGTQIALDRSVASQIIAA